MDRWKADLIAAARDAVIAFESVECVANEAHARAVIAALRAYSKESIGYIYTEPRTPDRPATQNARPTDVLILHPAVGAFFLEVKGWPIHEIASIEAGKITRNARGYSEVVDPWQQAQLAAGQLKTATIRIAQSRGNAREVPYFDWVVVLPNIQKADWEKRQFHLCLNQKEVLLSDDLINPAAFRAKIEQILFLKRRQKSQFSKEAINNVREALGSSIVINYRKRQASAQTYDKLGWQIDAYENKDKRLSKEQMELIDADFSGHPQIVRGVAGSGKSIVLIKNLVHMLDRQSSQLNLDPARNQRRYAVVCYNRSLVPFLRRRFEECYRELHYCDPPKNVDIYHLNGLQAELTNSSFSKRKGPLSYQRYSDYPEPKPALIASAYSAQLDTLAKQEPQRFDALLYDAIYVDEGQDLYNEEYLFLMRLLRVDPQTGLKNIVIFYDDAQNLYGRPRPNWSKLGIDVAGRRTRVMQTCFRNTREIVEFAFNVLLGVKSEVRATTRQFADVKYLEDKELVQELPDRWRVHFADRTLDSPPEVRLFPSRDAEVQWLVDTISHLAQKEEVRPEDILIVFRTDFDFKRLAEKIHCRCPELNTFIRPYGKASNPDKDRYIFEECALTLGTVESVKGYDAPIVFLVGADFMQNDKTGRACFYVAATRAKMRLYVSGRNVRGSLAEEALAVRDLLFHEAKRSTTVGGQ